MALTFTTLLDQGTRSYKTEGRVVVIVDMTTSTGSNGADYSSGFDLKGNASKIGLRIIEDVYGVYVRTSGGGINVLHAHWNVTTGKLQFFTTVTGTGASEVTTQIGTSAVVRFVASGV